MHHVPDMHRFVSTLAIALVTALGLLAAAPPYASADEGYRQTAATVYRLDPANGRLRVTVTLKVTNRTPDSQEPYSCIEYTRGLVPDPLPLHLLQHHPLLPDDDVGAGRERGDDHQGGVRREAARGGEGGARRGLHGPSP